MLGHEVPFSYCREPGKDLPCRKILDCWFETFDVDGFIHTFYTDDQIEQMLAPPADKLLTIVELIQQAKDRAKRNS